MQEYVCINLIENYFTDWLMIGTDLDTESNVKSERKWLLKRTEILSNLLCSKVTFLDVNVTILKHFRDFKESS